ncbi:hypothetical protein [Pasteuria penetrans]|uniref:hypothetical protein n=1 Tax=Pasteuria penetrans TaxID=86005 RepID=UPI000FA5639C|nr:hypothetical protein [Pasteuria penetrans]
MRMKMILSYRRFFTHMFLVGIFCFSVVPTTTHAGGLSESITGIVNSSMGIGKTDPMGSIGSLGQSISDTVKNSIDILGGNSKIAELVRNIFGGLGRV